VDKRSTLHGKGHAQNIAEHPMLCGRIGHANHHCQHECNQVARAPVEIKRKVGQIQLCNSKVSNVLVIGRGAP
jgi:hypothetical protein